LPETKTEVGREFTTAFVVAGTVILHPFTVTVTEYTPEAPTVALAIVGFCWEETNPLGPFQA